MAKVKRTVTDHVAWLCMDAQTSLNAIDEAMATELLEALTQSEADPQVRVIVITGAGKAFSAGGDIRFFHQLIQRGERVDMSHLQYLVGQLALRLRQSPKLIITAVRGAAAGAGANLALNGDFVFCSENAVFIQAFAALGLAPDTGGGYLLPRMIGLQRTMEYCVLAKPMPAAEAKDLGLVYKVCPANTLEHEVTAFAAQLTRGPLVAYTNIKRQVFSSFFQDYQHFLEHVEAATQNECAATGDLKEGVCAFLEKRPPSFKGC